MDDFDQVPKPEQVPYKYYAPLPKKKNERKQFPAQPCPECEKYYSSFPNAEQRARESCRHRGRNKRPRTPDHFWDLDFPSYDLPVKRYNLKPMWQNKYEDPLNLNRKLYEGLNIRLVPYFDSKSVESIIEALKKEIVYLPPESCCVVFDDFSKPRKKVPRKVAAYGDKGVKYTFSGNTYETKPWTETLRYLKDVAYELTGDWYNFVLVNFYKNGNDYIGAHRDNEPEIDPKSSIVSFSFGAERTFVFKRPHFPNYEMKLFSGSVLIMKPPTNKYWYHSLPKQKDVKDFRINLTFRKIRN